MNRRQVDIWSHPGRHWLYPVCRHFLEQVKVTRKVKTDDNKVMTGFKFAGHIAVLAIFLHYIAIGPSVHDI